MAVSSAAAGAGARVRARAHAGVGAMRAAVARPPVPALTRALHASSPAAVRRAVLPSMPDMSSLIALNERAVAAGGAPAGALPAVGRSDPALYTQLVPPPSSALAAVAARAGLLPPGTGHAERERVLALVLQACTHPSYYRVLDDATQLYHRLFPRLTEVDPAPQRQELESDKKLLRHLEATKASLQTNSALATVGHEILGMLSAEYVHLKYPHLSSDALKAATQAYSSTNTCAVVAPSFGLSQSKLLRHYREEDSTVPHIHKPVHKRANNVDRLLDIDAYYLARTRPPVSKRGKDALTDRDANAIAMRSLIGLVYQEKGFDAAKEFVNEYFLSRVVDVSKLLQFTNPQRLLRDTCDKYGRERPVARLVAESGREGNASMFVVAWYSGRLKLGEGFGMSIAMAEHRAATDALRRLYLAQVPFVPTNAPSVTFNEGGVAGPAEQPSTKAYYPPRIGTSEALHGIKRIEETWRWRK